MVAMEIKGLLKHLQCLRREQHSSKGQNNRNVILCVNFLVLFYHSLTLLCGIRYVLTWVCVSMTACSDSEARISSRHLCVYGFIVLVNMFGVTYSRQDLFHIGLQTEQGLMEDVLHLHNIPPDLVQKPFCFSLTPMVKISRREIWRICFFIYIY